MATDHDDERRDIGRELVRVVAALRARYGLLLDVVNRLEVIPPEDAKAVLAITGTEQELLKRLDDLLEALIETYPDLPTEEQPIH